MSIALTGTQYIINSSSPVTNYPITVGIWVRPAVTGVYGAIWHLSPTGDVNSRLAIYQNFDNTWSALATVVGVDSIAAVGTVTANAWVYLVARFISATNRRIAVLNATSAAAHAQNTTSASPASLAQLAIGADCVGGDACNGRFAELWYTNTDIQPDGAQLADITLRQLAYNGPFSIPYLVKDILEYRAFFSSVGSRDGEPDEVFWGSRGKQIYSTTGTPTIGLHVPLLLPTYRRPTDYHRIAVI